MSLGTRPTINGTDPLLEVHLFDFEGDLYGKYLSVDFVRRLRNEEKFASLDCPGGADAHRFGAGARGAGAKRPRCPRLRPLFVLS